MTMHEVIAGASKSSVPRHVGVRRPRACQRELSRNISQYPRGWARTLLVEANMREP
jgi:hypothetical protein